MAGIFPLITNNLLYPVQVVHLKAAKDSFFHISNIKVISGIAVLPNNNTKLIDL